MNNFSVCITVLFLKMEIRFLYSPEEKMVSVIKFLPKKLVHIFFIRYVLSELNAQSYKIFFEQASTGRNLF